MEQSVPSKESTATVRSVALTPATAGEEFQKCYTTCYKNVILMLYKISKKWREGVGGVRDRSTETKSRLLIAWGCEWGHGGLQRARRELSEVMEMSDVWVYGDDGAKDY